ncbi:CheR family methyltransferase [Mucilaginibacter pedocola]|uniref:Chemotaxis protein CheR n=1 Tax=Mucilaginibacter pedocola TaxID=1792845 RepID=A0A1S9PKE9_9SPHI|nr:protein-glutamate O-methyltransferase CheR [Mucilaginibacter pedocola]OOQ61420.1 chemotaxis protein CheR [Mucilaginibacter pedocola]
MESELAISEMAEILDVIRARYSYDLGGYAEGSLRRRFVRFAQIANVPLADLKYHITNDAAFFSWLLDSLTVNVTEMFRDPGFFRAFRETVLPELDKHAVIRIWHAGCSTGEEAFSMAILLHENGLLPRCRIYATDLNASNVEKAAQGILPLAKMKQYTTNYQQAGGAHDFSGYYTARYDGAIIDRELRRNIYCSVHNLATDASFNHFQLILCRNVLIYFKRALQNRALGLFADSLDAGGYLVLGNNESISTSAFAKKFAAVDKPWRIYKTEPLPS